MRPDEDGDEDDDLTTEEHRAVQQLGEELIKVVQRFHQHHPTIYVDLHMGRGVDRNPRRHN